DRSPLAAPAPAPSERRGPPVHPAAALGAVGAAGAVALAAALLRGKRTRRGRDQVPVVTGVEAGRVVGRSLWRKEDRRLLTGGSCFVDDFERPGALHA